MKSLLKCGALSFVLLITAVEVNYAQFGYSISTEQSYNSNPFRLSDENGELINTFDLGLRFMKDDFNILYYGSYSSFTESADRNYYWQQLGFYIENENTVYGIYGENRINKDIYDLYDYSDLTAYYRHRFLFDFAIPTINLSAAYRNYSNLSEYNNYFLSAGLSLNKSFESKTTFILTSALNYKNYINTGVDYITETSGDTTFMSGRGRGRMIRTISPGEQFVTQSSSIKNVQIFSNLRVAQSLFENTGAALYFTNRSLLSNNGAFAGDIMYNQGDESDLYDDPVSRDENALGINLTQILPLEITLKLGYEYSWRAYPSQGSYLTDIDYSNLIQREDEQSIFSLTANKSFSLNADDTIFLRANLNYYYLKNTSNSYWYNYDNQQISLGLGLEF